MATKNDKTATVPGSVAAHADAPVPAPAPEIPTSNVHLEAVAPAHVLTIAGAYLPFLREGLSHPSAESLV